MRIRSSSNRWYRKVLLLATLLPCLLSTEPVSAQSKLSNHKSELIREALVNVVNREKLPGMIAAIANADGVMAIGSAGVRKEGSNVAITDSDLFHIGSCTKAMTATLLAQFVDEGVITWDTTLIDVFPEYRIKIHPDYYKVTLWQLLTHRAGVPANAKDWWVHQKMELKARRQTIMLENLKEARSEKPGQFLYSNLGYMIAGSMAEKLSGTRWETLMKNYLFTPLKMDSVGFGPPGTKWKADQPWGHVKSAGKWQAKQFDNAEPLGPAGRVHCSIEDWAKFIALQLPGKNKPILDRKSLDRLIDSDDDYAAGWMVGERSWAKGITLTHSGSNTMWYAVVWVAPKLNRAFIVATNSMDEKSAAICDKMIGELISIDNEE
ncbi:MAG: beta-lactamase family protein [Verrucomicrobia bacterium]|nr:beta-lactamase family protein [Verrucomicrobiota bacterium]